MKRKIFWGSVVVTLLMLVSSQIVLLNTVKSDPTKHTGDADAGGFWISELDVSSDLYTIDYIGIGHANATDDWVLWEDGTGNITANWSVNIGAGNHPEYYVIFSLLVLNVDDDNKEIGNDTFSKTYTERDYYSESGNLSVAIEFTQQQMEEDSQTLVCYLDTYIQINNTVEAVNFSSMADDRSIVAVEFTTDGLPLPFSEFLKEANENLPPMWSWIDGWSSVFANEDDMLNNQTHFEVGSYNETPPINESNDPWHLFNITIMHYVTRAEVINFTIVEKEKYWKETPDGYVWGYTYTHYNMTGTKKLPVLMAFWLKFEYDFDFCTSLPIPFLWRKNMDPIDEFGGNITAFDMNNDSIIVITGLFFARSVGMKFFNLTFPEDGLRIHIDPNGTNSGVDDSISYYWEQKCSYQNCSLNLATDYYEDDGITFITQDISEVLALSNRFIYTFKGDTGNTRIEITC